VNPFLVTPDQRAAVLQVLADAKYLKDAHDAVRFAQIWTTDAHLAIENNGKALPTVVGRDAIMAFYHGNWARGSHGVGDARETHVAEHPYIEALPGDRLRAVHSTVFMAMSGSEPTLIGFATFTDELVFEDGSWRIASRDSSIHRR
jgi:hypothetical protein